MLSVKGLSGGYGRAQVLFDLSFDVGRGEVVCLMGRNGMGKTTTVKTVMGLLAPWAGDVSFEGRRLNGWSAARVARSGLGLVPEGRQIFPNLTLDENLLATAANRAGAPDPWTPARVFDLFPSLAERRASFGDLLSGGEQQMLAIGRALMTNPKLLILDEATEGLAPVVRDQIWGCLGRLRALGQSIVIIDKHVQKLSTLADRFYVLERGRIVWSGGSAELRGEHERLNRYLSVS
jgi:branched-chain amino acid transport system ATP-binding protein